MRLVLGWCLFVISLLARSSSLAGTDSTPPVNGPARTDFYGDPLPSGAVARMGSSRLRHGQDVHALAYSPDRKRIASASADRTVRVWDAASGKELYRFPHQNPDSSCLAFAPDRSLFAPSRTGNTAHGS